jgi:hypothetical protein
VIHEAKTREALKALRLDVDLCFIEAEEGLLILLLGNARVADAG